MGESPSLVGWRMLVFLFLFLFPSSIFSNIFSRGEGEMEVLETRTGENFSSLNFRTGEVYSFRTGKLLGFIERGNGKKRVER